MSQPIIPVLMYHGISEDVRKVPYGFLLQHVDQFETCMRYLVRNGFTTITLRELYSHLKSNSPLPPKPIVLTFDDGYLDNWVFVYPILKRYALKATVFVVSDFVDPLDACRPNMGDASSDKTSAKDLKWWGYLSWPEMKDMEKDGVIDIQCHSTTHTWYFCSNRIVDFHHPGDGYPWLAWNQRPERKYKWVDEQQDEFVGYGAPVYEYGRSLGIRRYLDDQGLCDYLVEFVRSSGSATFFDNSKWRKILRQKVEYYRTHYIEAGRYETDGEYRNRLESEIVESKKLLETRLQKKIDFLCWPGGAHTPEAYALAMKHGYLATTKGEQRNSYGVDPAKLHRTATYLDSHRYSRGFLKLVALPLFVLEVQSYRGHFMPTLLMRSAANAVHTSRAVQQLLSSCFSRSASSKKAFQKSADDPI